MPSQYVGLEGINEVIEGGNNRKMELVGVMATGDR